jgi:hypothetical protein
MQRNVLSHKQVYELTNFVKERFQAACTTDAEFAVLATKELGFPVNASNIKTPRDFLGLVSFRDQARQAKTRTLEGVLERLEVLESTVEDLERKMTALQMSVKGVRL